VIETVLSSRRKLKFAAIKPTISEIMKTKGTEVGLYNTALQKINSDNEGIVRNLKAMTDQGILF